MNLYKISWRFLFSKKNFSYTNISIFLSIISLSFSLSISLLVISTSRGYENELLKSIQSTEPDITITSRFNDLMTIDEYKKIKNELYLIDSSIAITPYLKKYGMIKNSNSSHGVSVISLENQGIDNYYTFDNTSNFPPNEKNSFLCMSDKLKNKIGCKDNTEIILFDIGGMIETSRIRAEKIILSSTFSPKIPIFTNTVFISMPEARKLFNLKESYSGILVNNVKDEFIDSLESSNLNLSYSIETWDEKYENLLFWLTIFTNPIYLILFFIISLSIIYQIFANWLLFSDKSSSFRQLRILGIENKKITVISIGVSMTILLFSLFFGSVLALILSYLQNNYSIIGIDPSIYILSALHSEIYYSDFLYICLPITISVLLFSKIIISNMLKRLSDWNPSC